MRQVMRELLAGNAELPFLKILKQQGLSEQEEMLFMLVCQRTLLGDPRLIFAPDPSRLRMNPLIPVVHWRPER